MDDVEEYGGTPFQVHIPVMPVSCQEWCGGSFPLGAEQIVTLIGQLKGLDPICDPYQGECFTDSAQQMPEVAALLESALPQDWQGFGADAYSTHTSSLVTAAQRMADLDDQMQQDVADHARSVRSTQAAIGVTQDLFAAFYVTVVRPLESQPGTAEIAYGWIFALAAFAHAAAWSAVFGVFVNAVDTTTAVNSLDYGAVASSSSSSDSSGSASDASTQPVTPTTTKTNTVTPTNQTTTTTDTDAETTPAALTAA